MATNKTIGTLLFRIESDTKALRKGMTDMNKQIGGLKKSFNTLAGVVGVAFSAQVITKFTKEIIKLAGEAEGVKEAFAHLPHSEKLINSLTAATRGTVSQLQLMKYAVQAKNFKIPLDQLATYFEFATKRAAQTGESVDYLVQSIITGIGRKSVMIMDNLGISAAELSAKFKEMGDFGAAAGEIIRTELEMMGDVAITTGQKIQSLSAAWEDLKTRAGERLIGVLNEAKRVAEDIKRIYDAIPKFAPGEFAKGQWGVGTGTRAEYEKIYGKTPGAKLGLGMIKSRFKTRPLSVPNIALPPPSWAVKTRVPGSDKGIPAPIASLGAGLLDTSEKVAQLEERMSHLNTQTIPESEKSMMELGLVVQQAFMSAVDAFGSFIEKLAVGDMEMAFDDILKAFGGFLVQMGKMITAYGIAALTLQTALVEPWKAIAAGIALVAIGSAISGLAARGPAGMGTAGGHGGRYGGAVQTIKVESTSILQGQDIYMQQKKVLNSHSRM